MKQQIVTIILIAGMLASCHYKSQPSNATATDEGKDNLPASVKLISTTPVKDQGESEMCWAYAMLGTIESEHIMKGDSVNLSTAYIARMMLHEKALEYYFSGGKKDISMRGMGSMLIHYIDKYGAQPYDSYEDPEHINYKVLCRKVEQICDGAISKRTATRRPLRQRDRLYARQASTHARRRIHSTRVCPQRMLSRGICIAHQLHASPLSGILCPGSTRQCDAR